MILIHVNSQFYDYAVMQYLPVTMVSWSEVNIGLHVGNDVKELSKLEPSFHIT